MRPYGIRNRTVCCGWGWRVHLAGERDDPFALEPLYLRPSSAEEHSGRGRAELIKTSRDR